MTEITPEKIKELEKLLAEKKAEYKAELKAKHTAELLEKTQKAIMAEEAEETPVIIADKILKPEGEPFEAIILKRCDHLRINIHTGMGTCDAHKAKPTNHPLHLHFDPNERPEKCTSIETGCTSYE
jgi:uncharacterized protein YaaW (UPF0174 family)